MFTSWASYLMTVIVMTMAVACIHRQLATVPLRQHAYDRPQRRVPVLQEVARALSLSLSFFPLLLRPRPYPIRSCFGTDVMAAWVCQYLL